MKGLDELKPKDGKKTLKVRFANITKDNLGQFRRLNLSIFPVRYPDKFYRDILKGDCDNELVRLAYHSDMLVGAVAGRLEDSAGNVLQPDTKKGKPAKNTDPGNPKRLYIMTLGVLQPYRGMGVASQLLQHLVHYVKSCTAVNAIYLHVQLGNQVALDFYSSFQFKVVDTLKGYYKRIEPADCYIVERKFTDAERTIEDEKTEEKS